MAGGETVDWVLITFGGWFGWCGWCPEVETGERLRKRVETREKKEVQREEGTKR